MARVEPASLRWLWNECLTFIPGVKLGGICANKQCYHNSLEENQAHWPGGYCCVKSADLSGNRKACRAIDLTMSTAEMITRSKLLQTACLNNDPRVKYLREWIGTVDGVNVICYIHDSPDGPWRKDTSRDSSHLWHIHLSFFTTYADNQTAAEAVASTMKGEVDMGYGMLCREGDVGPVVGALQNMLNVVEPDPALVIAIDDSYGPKTSAKLSRVLATVGWMVDGRNFLAGEYERLLAVHVIKVCQGVGIGAVPGPPGPPGPPGEPGAPGEPGKDAVIEQGSLLRIVADA